MGRVENVVIIGSGPAGLTAAIYTAREMLSPLVITGAFGGQPMLTDEIENYPGFPEGVKGPALVEKMRKQAEKFGANFLEGSVEKVDFSSKPFKIFVDGDVVEAKSVIIATGASPRMLGVEGEKEFFGRGVSVCATCDAAFFKGKTVAVVGGGDTAMTEALTLLNFVNKLYIIHRRDTFTASKILQERVLSNPKVEPLFNFEVQKIIGTSKVEGVLIKNKATSELKELKCDGVFLAIGLSPNSAVFEGLQKDKNGYIEAVEEVKTNIPGVFVAGDVCDKKYRQVVIAAGSGAKAAIEAIEFLHSYG